VLALIGKIDGGHATISEQPLYGVAIVKRSFGSERRLANGNLPHAYKLPWGEFARTGFCATFAAMLSPLEELHRSLVLLRRGQAAESAEVFATASLCIFLPRVQAVLPGFELPNHVTLSEKMS
jgi:hypothetical protein